MFHLKSSGIHRIRLKVIFMSITKPVISTIIVIWALFTILVAKKLQYNQVLEVHLHSKKILSWQNHTIHHYLSKYKNYIYTHLYILVIINIKLVMLQSV